MKRLYAFYQAHDVTDLADIEKDVSAIITKGRDAKKALETLTNMNLEFYVPALLTNANTC